MTAALQDSLIHTFTARVELILEATPGRQVPGELVAAAIRFTGRQVAVMDRWFIEDEIAEWSIKVGVTATDLATVALRRIWAITSTTP